MKSFFLFALIAMVFTTAQSVRADEITLIAPGGILSEIHNPGVDIVGPLPREISTPTALIGFVSTHAKAPAAARALLTYLSSPFVADIYKSLGMVPGR